MIYPTSSGSALGNKNSIYATACVPAHRAFTGISVWSSFFSLSLSAVDSQDNRSIGLMPTLKTDNFMGSPSSCSASASSLFDLIEQVWRILSLTEACLLFSHSYAVLPEFQVFSLFCTIEFQGFSQCC